MLIVEWTAVDYDEMSAIRRRLDGPAGRLRRRRAPGHCRELEEVD